MAGESFAAEASLGPKTSARRNLGLATMGMRLRNRQAARHRRPQRHRREAENRCAGRIHRRPKCMPAPSEKGDLQCIGRVRREAAEDADHEEIPRPLRPGGASDSGKKGRYKSDGPGTGEVDGERAPRERAPGLAVTQPFRACWATPPRPLPTKIQNRRFMGRGGTRHTAGTDRSPATTGDAGRAKPESGLPAAISKSALAPDSGAGNLLTCPSRACLPASLHSFG